MGSPPYFLTTGTLLHFLVHGQAEFAYNYRTLVVNLEGRNSLAKGRAVTVILYARESTSDQELGLEAQRTRLDSEATYRRWSDKVFISDLGYSARSLNRPGIQRALSMLESGEADTLVACKLDRLSRSVADFVALVALAEQQGWNLVVLDLALDLSSPQGKFVASVMASAAQLERDLCSLRTREALAVKRAQGVKLGRPVRTSPEVREFISKARAQGYTLTAICRNFDQSRDTYGTGGKTLVSIDHFGFMSVGNRRKA